jgi:hypothetical protein
MLRAFRLGSQGGKRLLSESGNFQLCSEEESPIPGAQHIGASRILLQSLPLHGMEEYPPLIHIAHRIRVLSS